MNYDQELRYEGNPTFVNYAQQQSEPGNSRVSDDVNMGNESNYIHQIKEYMQALQNELPQLNATMLNFQGKVDALLQQSYEGTVLPQINMALSSLHSKVDMLQQSEGKKENKKQLKHDKHQLELQLEQKDQEIKALKENERKITETLDNLRAKMNPGAQQKTSSIFDLSWLWTSNQKRDQQVRKLQNDNEVKDQQIVKLTAALTEKDAIIARLSGKKLDYLEKAAAVYDISNDTPRSTLDSYKQLSSKKLFRLIPDLTKLLKRIDPRSADNILQKYPFFKQSPEQLYIQMKISVGLKQCFETATDFLKEIFARRYEACLKGSLWDQDDKEYIDLSKEQARKYYDQGTQISSAVAINVVKASFDLLFQPGNRKATDSFIVATSQFLSRTIKTINTTKVMQYKVKIKEVFWSSIKSVIGDVPSDIKQKHDQVIGEIANVVWNLTTTSPPYIIWSGETQYNSRLHTLHASATANTKKLTELHQAEDDPDNCKFPKVCCYATLVVFINYQGHVAVKAEVFI